MREDVTVTDPFAVPDSPVPSPPPSAPAYGEPLHGPVRNGLGTAALVLGLVALPLCLLIGPAVLAIVFGVMGMRRAQRGEATNRGMALAGTILGGVSLALGAAFIWLIIYVVRSPEFDVYQTCDDRAVTTEQHDACIQDLADTLFG